jgi:multiple sugar transport system substrate-binding protein
MTTRYLGVTWDHPRGRDALVAATPHALDLDIEIVWAAQSLEDFESRPIEDLCARYDVVVLDHPHVGEAAIKGVLQPLDLLYPAEVLSEIAHETIGPCFDSYRYAGHVWGLPLDAASQVMVLRPDLLGGPEPSTWSEVEALSQRTGAVALSLAGPHALLTLFSIAAALKGDAGEGDGQVLLAADAGREAVELMSRLLARVPTRALELNPIALLNEMASHDEIALCPLVYGYVNYAVAGPRRHALRFVNAPRGSAGGRPGSTLGGTGIAISARCLAADSLLEHLRWLMSPAIQNEFIPANSGQPSRRSAWLQPGLSGRWGGFYGSTLETLERAFVRPRYPGYVAFQASASAYLRAALAEGRSAERVVHDLNEMHRSRRQSGPAQEDRLDA